MKMRKSIMALEGIEEPVDTTPLPEVDMSNELLDVSDGIRQIDDTTGSIDDAIAVTESLESLMTALKDSDGLDPTGAKILQISVESLCARVGYKKQVIPALEAFGGTMSKQAATQLALEGAKEVWDTVWKHIKAAFEKVKKFFSELYAKFDLAWQKLKLKFSKTQQDVANWKSIPKTEVSSGKGESSKREYLHLKPITVTGNDNPTEDQVYDAIINLGVDAQPITDLMIDLYKSAISFINSQEISDYKTPDVLVESFINIAKQTHSMVKGDGKYILSLDGKLGGTKITMSIDDKKAIADLTVDHVNGDKSKLTSSPEDSPSNTPPLTPEHASEAIKEINKIMKLKENNATELAKLNTSYETAVYNLSNRMHDHGNMYANPEKFPSTIQSDMSRFNNFVKELYMSQYRLNLELSRRINASLSYISSCTKN